jgi:hypothetical protein
MDGPGKPLRGHRRGDHKVRPAGMPIRLSSPDKPMEHLVGVDGEDDVGLGGPSWSPVGGACCPFITLTAKNRATLPSPAGDHEGHPYGSS